MHSVIRRRRRGTASAIGFLIAATVFGVLLMHSVTPTTTPMPMSMPMSSAISTGGGLASMATPPLDRPVPVMSGEHDCPTAHQLMHPCVGTTMPWPALSVPAISAGIDCSPTSADRLGGRTDSTWGRAPPWTLWELDRSVTLRV
ncbi:hypothetical protein [Rhodococcoides fascians]|uniref:hypothetical protein n=1 Tax=Rhodococcoides fascians TaxID=1828 RepID=UPI000564BEFB|nr:hypothetical protein [Rhodococcus fascians]